MQTLGICSCSLASFSVPCVFMLQYIPQSPGFAAKSSGSATCQALNMRDPQSGWLRCLSHGLRRQNPQLLKPPSLLHCPGSCLSYSEITNTSRSFTIAKVALITGASGITGAAVLEYDSAAFEHLAKHTTASERSRIIVTSRSPLKITVSDTSMERTSLRCSAYSRSTCLCFHAFELHQSDL